MLMEYNLKQQSHEQTMAQKRMDLTAAGLATEEVDDDGRRKVAPDHTPALMEVMQKLAETLGKANSPKRVVRDENGDVIGIEAIN